MSSHINGFNNFNSSSCTFIFELYSFRPNEHKSTAAHAHIELSYWNAKIRKKYFWTTEKSERLSETSPVLHVYRSNVHSCFIPKCKCKTKWAVKQFRRVWVCINLGLIIQMANESYIHSACIVTNVIIR